jgi:hypothetical protein
MTRTIKLLKGFKVAKKGDKMVLEEDEEEYLKSLPVSKRLQVKAAKNKKLRYGRKY